MGCSVVVCGATQVPGRKAVQEAICAALKVTTRCGGPLPLCHPTQAVAYCSRECQAKNWKEGGHKAECGRLAAQRGG